MEHIAPQKENNERLKSGYCAYDDDFYQRCYLNCIGNLLLIGGSHNASIGNKAFSEKLESYQNSSLSQQQEIKNFVEAEKKWDKPAIGKRHHKIVGFVLATWSL
ncbi:HNH endonuclease family protein [Helicobacter suis]|uniref:HNH endonuclease family protein n=1 Tax=Helicobacter suis TaxID=104628 RepID=UPI002D772BE1|nr:HNH endonuclease family protein [Helicobacter suis]